MVEALQRVNGLYVDCMDGRVPVAYAQMDKRGKVTLLEVGEQALAVNSIAMPGAGLGPVAYLEKNADVKTMDAVAATEQAFRHLGLLPTFHIDNKHGHFDVMKPETNEVSEDRLVALIKTTLEGCGFAGLMWGERAGDLLTTLRQRGWIVQVLLGHHPENSAHRVQRPGYAIHHATAHQIDEPTFAMNDHETHETMETLSGVLRMSGMLPYLNGSLATQAMPWFTGQFEFIARKLRSVPVVNVLR